MKFIVDPLPWKRIKASIGSGGGPVNESKASPSAESQAVQTSSSSNETSVCDSAEYFYHTRYSLPCNWATTRDILGVVLALNILAKDSYLNGNPLPGTSFFLDWIIY